MSIEDQIDAWHQGAGEGKSLHEFLGWSHEKYAAYVQGFGTWEEECDIDSCDGTHYWARWPEDDGTLGWIVGHTTFLPQEAFDAFVEALDGS